MPWNIRYRPSRGSTSRGNWSGAAQILFGSAVNTVTEPFSGGWLLVAERSALSLASVAVAVLSLGCSSGVGVVSCRADLVSLWVPGASGLVGCATVRRARDRNGCASKDVHAECLGDDGDDLIDRVGHGKGHAKEGYYEYREDGGLHC